MRNHSLAVNVIAKGTLNLFNALLPLILVRYVYRVIGPVNIGSVEYATATMGYFALLGALGIYNYGLRTVSAHRGTPELVRSVFKNLVGIGVVSNFLAILIYVAFVYFFVHTPLLRTVSWILCGNIIAQFVYVEWYNEGMEQFVFITIKTVIIRVLSLAFVFIFIHDPGDVYIYVVITSGVMVANNIVSYIYARRNVGIPIRDMFRGLNFKPYIVPLLTIMVLNNTVLLYTMADRTILGYFTTEENVAFLSISSKVAEMTRTLLLSVVFATLPRLSLYLREDKLLYQSGVLKIMRMVLFLTVPTGIGLFMLSPEVIDFFGGREYVGAVPVMRLFSLRMIMLGVEAIMYNQVIFLHGRERRLVVYNLLCGLLNVALNLVFLSVLDPLVSMLCTFASEIVFETLCYRFITLKLKVKLGIFKLYLLKYFAVAALFVPVIMGLDAISLGTSATLAIGITACGLVYFIILAVMKDTAACEILGYAKRLIPHKNPTNND